MKITRMVNGEEMVFELTKEEVSEVIKEDKVDTAKDVLQNYEELIVDYEAVIQDEEKLLQYYEAFQDLLAQGSGEKELEAISEVFEMQEE